MDKEKFLEVTGVDKYSKILDEQNPITPATPKKSSWIKRTANMPVGKKLAVGALGTAAAVGGAGYGLYRGIKGIAKGAVNAVRYPFRPYERQDEEE